MSEKTPAERLSEALVSRKALAPEALARLEKFQKESGRGILHALNELELMPAAALVEFASAELQIPFLRLARYRIPPEILSVVPKKVAYARQVIPVAKIGNLLMLAMSDPLDSAAADDVKQATNLSVVPILSSRRDIVEALDAFYGEESSAELRHMVEDMQVEGVSVVRSDATEPAASVTELMSLTKEEPVVRLTDHILAEGVRRRASDIFVEPRQNEFAIRYRIDGVLREGPRPPRSMHQGVVSRIKILSNLNIAEHRIPQDGRCKLRIQRRLIDFRISTVPTYYGEKVCLRILDPQQAGTNLDQLGFDEHNLKDLIEAGERPYGMILTCGPTGSGKTTTLYGLLQHLNRPEKNLVTIEDPVEYAVRGINQVSTRSELGLSFAAALRAILRQDPNVILVGEIRDSETADVAVKASLTGHLVLSTLHTNTAVGCLIRLSNIGIEPFLIASSLVLAASQRLVRKLCSCREEYAPAPELKRLLGIAEAGKVTLFKPRGCAKCGQSGYLGRASVMETLRITPKIRELIVKKATEDEIRAAARAEGMVSLRESALAKMRQGITSAEEVLRVSLVDEKAPG